MVNSQLQKSLAERLNEPRQAQRRLDKRGSVGAAGVALEKALRGTASAAVKRRTGSKGKDQD